MTAAQQKAIEQTADYVRKKFEGEVSGHDWWHMYRVWQLAKHIARREKGVDPFAVELAALMHDVADVKFSGSEAAGRREIRTWLQKLKLDETVIEAVLSGVQDISFSSSLPGSKSPRHPATLVAQIVSDADQLDGIGAIGIGRTFTYGGSKGRLMHHPDRPPQAYASAEEYHTNDTPTLNHFYEKLLLLKDRMHTGTAREIAQHRHKVMEEFLNEFHAEWEGAR